MLTSQLHIWNVQNQRVFLRADLNVPINSGTIINDFKLKAIVPTLDLLLKQNAGVVLATHLGRPKGFDLELSTKPLGPWLENHGYKVKFVPFQERNSFAGVTAQPGEIVLLENMRFFAGEQTHGPSFEKELNAMAEDFLWYEKGFNMGEPTPPDRVLAEQLAALADYYVHDAFALMHRDDTSVTLVPRLFNPSHRTIGILVEKEVAALSKLVHNPEKPFVLIVGGGKVADKIPLLTGMLDRVTHILLCPAIVFTFLKAEGKQVGTSLVDDSQLESVKKFMQKATQKKVQLIFPVDYQVAQDSMNGPLSIVSVDQLASGAAGSPSVDGQRSAAKFAQPEIRGPSNSRSNEVARPEAHSRGSYPQFPPDGVGMSIGPETAKLFATYITQAKTVFFNGLPGIAYRSETLEGAQAIFAAMTQSHGFTVIGGGDSVAAAELLIDVSKIKYCSTGGGATLTYLAHKTLPGLQLFEG